jgi:hypothetical protein
MRNKFLLFFSLMLFFVAKVSAQDTFTQITSLSDLTSGEYLIVGDGANSDGIMVNSTISAPAITYTAVTNPGNVISTGFTSDNVFTVTVTGTAITIYHETVGYVSWGKNGATGNHANFFNGTPTANETWNVTVDNGLFILANGNTAGRKLQWNNGSPRFAAYTGDQVKLKLYKKTEVVDPTNFTITVTQPEGGSITPAGTVEVEPGASATFTATPSSICYTFSHWVVDGEEAGNENPYTFSDVNDNHTLTAVFETIPDFTIDATAGANGTIAPNGQTFVSCGSLVTYTITANAGFQIEDVVVDGVSVGAVATYSFNEVIANHTIEVSFEEIIIEPGEACVSEDFSNIPAPASGYSTRTWSGFGGEWNATNARTDQTLEGKAICTNNVGSVTSPTFTNGIGTLKFDYVRGFTGTGARSIEVYVNGEKQGNTITVNPTSNEVQSYSADLNIDGSVVVQLRTSGAQIIIDNVEWTCFGEAPCETPMPTADAQEFCAGATVADLVAEGEDIKWYAAADATESLEATTELVSGSYFATQTIDECESDKLEVIVTVNDMVTAPTAEAQEFCGTATVADLVAEGEGIQWFVSADAMEALEETVVLESGSYFVSQTIGNCESERVEVQVTLNEIPAAPIAEATQEFTEGQTLADLVVEGEELTWYDADGNVLEETTELVDGTTYYVSQTMGECESETTAITVVLAEETEGPCFEETFNELTEIATGSSYAAGTYTNNEITWNFHGQSPLATSQGDFPIDGQGILLRRASDSYLETTVPAGVGTFSFEYRKAYTGGNARQLELLVNGTSVAITPEFGAGSGENTTVYTFSYDLNTTAPTLVKIKLSGSADTNRHVTVDNISWTCDIVEPCNNTITATAGANGSITPSGDVIVECGENQTFTITANPGFEIADVLVDGESVGAVASYTFEDVNEDHTIEVTFEEIETEGPCFEETFNELTEIATGSSYAAGTYTNNEITWNFHGQSPLATSQGDFPIDGQGILLRRASDSYLETTVPAGVGTFSFEYRKAYTGGNARQLELLVNGTSVAITPEFGAGSGENTTVYTFSYDLNTTAPTLVKIKLSGSADTNRHVTVDNISWTCDIVEPCNNTITATAGANGSITPSGDVVVECGENQTFTITANPGFEIADVLVDGESVGAVSTYTFEDVNEDHTIDVTFEEIETEGPCFEETFNELTEIATGTNYAAGSYTNNGITWNFHGQSPIGAGAEAADYTIEEQGILLRRASDSFLEATIPAGVSVFSFEYRKAYTGGNARQLEVLVNGVSVATTAEFGAGSGEDATVYTFNYVMNAEEPVTVRIKLTGETTTNRHATIDNISWTCEMVEPCDVPAPIAVSPQQFTQGQTLADLVVEGENLTWYDADGNILPETTEMVDGATYYVTSSNEICESEATAIEVYIEDLGNGAINFAKFNYYPNPVKDKLNIVNSTEITEVSIFNLAGGLVFSNTTSSKAVQLNVAQLSTGIYIVKVVSGNETKTFKMIKK